ncbi:MAG: phosphoribosylanthranilate isomerase [Spirochaetes bacterium]|nr:phosphoribosylanthranilate isomerase [Spirochaetota bacterium]
MFIKFCGFTREEDVRFATGLDSVNAIGYIFHEKSKRYISPEFAGKLSEIIDTFNESSSGKRILKTGIFVEQTLDETLEMAAAAKLDILQIYNAQIAAELEKHYPVFFTARVRDKSVLNDLPVLSGKSFYLLDAYNEKQAGGSGDSFDWSLLNDFSEIDRTIVAGGIGLNNIEKVLSIPGIYGIDLSSGIEDEPGIKSSLKMKKLDSAIMEVINGKLS